MMTRTLLSTALSLAVSGAAVAGPYARHGDNYYDYAKVIRVDPIVEVVQVPVDRRECWDEEVVQRDVRRGPGSPAGVLLGGLVGGVVGNQIGRGHDRDLATVAGAVVGAAAGHELSRPQYVRDYPTVEQRCELVRDYRDEERVDGYRVTYRYKGQTFVTRMDYDPGPRIPVDINVRPLDDRY